MVNNTIVDPIYFQVVQSGRYPFLRSKQLYGGPALEIARLMASKEHFVFWATSFSGHFAKTIGVFEVRWVGTWTLSWHQVQLLKLFPHP